MAILSYLVMEMQKSDAAIGWLIVLALCLLPLFAVGTPLLFIAVRHQVEYNAEGMKVINMWGSTNRMSWQEVAAIKNESMLSMLHFETADGRRITIHHQITGFKPFVQFAYAQTGIRF